MLVVLALIAAGCYGAADFCGGLASRRASTTAVVVWSQAVGLAVLLPLLVLGGGTASTADVGWGAACGVSGAVAIAFLYQALAVGTMGVVSPITAVLAAVIPVVFAAVRGERPAPLALFGIGCAVAAVVLVSASTPAPRAAASGQARTGRVLPPGIGEALVAGTGFGVFFITLAQAHGGAGFYPLLATRLVSVAILAGAGLALRRPLRVARAALPAVVAAGALDMGANVTYVLASHAGSLSIAVVITSLYPAGTVALAAVVLGERLAAPQWLGIAIAFAGVLCISLAR
jgi:drug/metabolite transporter (DMT)-like permease